MEGLGLGMISDASFNLWLKASICTQPVDAGKGMVRYMQYQVWRCRRRGVLPCLGLKNEASKLLG